MIFDWKYFHFLCQYTNTNFILSFLSFNLFSYKWYIAGFEGKKPYNLLFNWWFVIIIDIFVFVVTSHFSFFPLILLILVLICPLLLILPSLELISFQAPPHLSTLDLDIWCYISIPHWLPLNC